MLDAVIVPTWMYVTIIVGVFGTGFLCGYEVHRTRTERRR